MTILRLAFLFQAFESLHFDSLYQERKECITFFFPSLPHNVFLQELHCTRRRLLF